MRPIRRVLCAALAAPLLPVFAAAPAAAAQQAAPLRTVYYAADDAPDYQDAIVAAVANWNADVHNVQIKPSEPGGMLNIVIREDDGWPYTEPSRLGSGDITLGRDAALQGYDRVRIVAHEMGHILGLGENRDGQCSTLMSGHTAPVSCTNAHPNATERATVEQLFADAAGQR